MPKVVLSSPALRYCVKMEHRVQTNTNTNTNTPRKSFAIHILTFTYQIVFEHPAHYVVHLTAVLGTCVTRYHKTRQDKIRLVTPSLSL